MRTNTLSEEAVYLRWLINKMSKMTTCSKSMRELLLKLSAAAFTAAAVLPEE